MLQADLWKGEVAVNTVKADITRDGKGELELLGWKGEMQKLIKYPKTDRIPEIINTWKNLPHVPEAGLKEKSTKSFAYIKV